MLKNEGKSFSAGRCDKKGRAKWVTTFCFYLSHFRGGRGMSFGANALCAARRREDAARPHTALTSFACKGLLKYCVFDTLFRPCGPYFALMMRALAMPTHE